MFFLNLTYRYIDDVLSISNREFENYLGQNFDYKMIADRLRTVSWSSKSHQTGMVKPVSGIPTFPLTATAMNQKDTHLKFVKQKKTEGQQSTIAGRP